MSKRVTVVEAAIAYDRTSRKVAAHEDAITETLPAQRQRAIVDEDEAPER